MLEFTPEQLQAVQLLRDENLVTDDGMPEELFLFISGLIPLANVDLLITNASGEILLTRRKDSWYQNSWHIPGGCMHYGESFLHCVQATAMRELGTAVEVDTEPLTVRNVIRGINKCGSHPRERGHNVAILFQCTLPPDYQIDNGTKTDQDDGYAAWFQILPKDFMEIQHVYDDILSPWIQNS